MKLGEIDVSCPDNHPREREFYQLLEPAQDLYQRHLGRVDMKRAAKVVLYCAEGNEARTPSALNEGVLIVAVPVDFSRLLDEKNEVARQKQAIAVLHKGLIKAAKFVGADESPFEAAREAAVQRLREPKPVKQLVARRTKSRAKR